MFRPLVSTSGGVARRMQREDGTLNSVSEGKGVYRILEKCRRRVVLCRACVTEKSEKATGIRDC
jgi:hypothetical protein